jgi:hypothetical protein
MGKRCCRQKVITRDVVMISNARRVICTTAYSTNTRIDHDLFLELIFGVEAALYRIKWLHKRPFEWILSPVCSPY